MATGVASPREIEYCAHGEAVLRAIQNGTIGSILHRRTGRKWLVHMTLVESECQADQLEEDIYEDCYLLGSKHDPATFDLFVQWLYTRKYQEKKLARFHAGSEDIALADLDWAIKAAVLCWELGASLGAKDFQNYAMERLFEAFSRPLARPLTVFLILHTYEVDNQENWHNISPLQRLIQDVIVRNWGDDTIVQHGDQEIWSDTLEHCHYFRRGFIEATSKTLEKRREQQLSLEDYLIYPEFDLPHGMS